MLRGAHNLCASQITLYIIRRHLTATEVSTALRPFYFSVHPDLFGKHPEERAVNENSLQQLSSILNTLQSRRPVRPIILPFYLKDKQKGATFRAIKIYVKERDIKSAIINILKSCELSTDYIDKIEEPVPKSFADQFKLKTNDIDLTKANKEHPIYASYVVQQKIKEVKESIRLKNWLKSNFEDALKQSEAGKASRIEIERLCILIKDDLGLTSIKWDCGWNNTHFRGCLLAFKSLAEQHPEAMHILRGRNLVFSNYTGVDLEGNVMLYSGEVRHNWLDFIKNIRTHDLTLMRIPAFEKSLSHVLRNIKVVRRKFMPKIRAGDYENNLRQITTSLSDYIGYKPLPKEWPKSLEAYEIVIETEAGPLMVSPTGQFIVPATIPGTLLVHFISTNLKEAGEKIKCYKRDKHIEKSLHQQCKSELNLAFLLKDDSVTPDLMIQCLNNLLQHKNELSTYTKDIHLNITTYYSVLTDGVVCIPWNFKL